MRPQIEVCFDSVPSLSPPIIRRRDAMDLVSTGNVYAGSLDFNDTSHAQYLPTSEGIDNFTREPFSDA